MRNPVRFLRLLLALFLFAAVAAAQQTSAPLTNDDVIKMMKGGLQESTIVSAIAANETSFDVSANGLLALKQAGISDKILDAMVAAEAKKKNTPAAPAVAAAPAVPAEAPPAEAAAEPAPSAANPAAANAAMAQSFASMGLTPQMMAKMPPAARQQMMAAMAQMRSMNMPGMSGLMGMNGMDSGGFMLAPEQMPKVMLLAGTDKKPMRSSMAQMAQSATKGMPGGGSATGSMLTSLATQGLSFAAIGAGGMFAGPAMGIATGMMGGLMGGHHGMPTTTYVWALPGRNSGFIMPTISPKFDLEFGEIVGLDPDSYEPALVHLPQTKDNWRLVGATKQKMDYSGSTGAQSMVDEVRTPVKMTRLDRGHVQIEAASPLAPGEYGLVLRPLKAHKPKKGQSQSDAQQALFYSVWDFNVPGQVDTKSDSKKSH